jgi:hypothetical protein
VAISESHVNARAISGWNSLFQSLDILGPNVAEYEVVERRRHAQSAERRTVEFSPGLSIDAKAWPGEEVQVNKFEPLT